MRIHKSFYRAFHTRTNNVQISEWVRVTGSIWTHPGHDVTSMRMTSRVWTPFKYSMDEVLRKALTRAQSFWKCSSTLANTTVLRSYIFELLCLTALSTIQKSHINCYPSDVESVCVWGEVFVVWSELALTPDNQRNHVVCFRSQNQTTMICGLQGALL